MVTFVLAAILITLATLAFLVWPLIFTRNTFSYARHAQNIHYAKERLAELEEQLKNASISATDYEALKLEIETTLAQDIDLSNSTESESSPLPRRPNKAAIFAICVFLPLGAAATYIYVGTPEALSGAPVSTVANAQHSNEQVSAKEINQMVGKLEKRLIDSPNDLQGWALLSRTYLALGQYSKAANGLRKVLELGGESGDIYASLADATALIAEGDMSGEPTAFAEKALSLAPNNRQALWLRGLAAVQANDHTTAKQHWGVLMSLLSDQPAEQSQLQEIMNEAFDTDSATPQELLAATNQKATKPAATVANNTQPSEANNNKGLQVLVSVAPSIARKLNLQDPVFIFARAVNGPPPPLAVKRLRVADLPTTIFLSDNDAMMPQFKMSLFPDITVSARISKSGQPVAQAGDFQSAVVEAQPGQVESINLSIETLIE